VSEPFLAAWKLPPIVAERATLIKFEPRYRESVGWAVEVRTG